MRSQHPLINHSSRGHARRPIRRPVSFLAKIVAHCLFPNVSESSNLGGADGLAQGPVIGGRSAEAQVESAEGQCQPMTQIHGPNDCFVRRGYSIFFQEESCEEKGQPGRVTIDTLPDDVLLEIFSCYLLEDLGSYQDDDTETWHTLIHVCRRWRNIVFDSPRRLNLRIRCTARTRAAALLDVWPALPIVIRDPYPDVHSESGQPLMEGANNIVAALELKDRVHQISFWNYPSPRLERIAAAMLGSFPALSSLDITSTDETMPDAVFPEAFLGGSAPRLRSCFLMGLPFPGIQRLLLSAHHLVSLTLRDVPHSGYISPGLIVTCLSALPNLKQLWLGFSSRESIPDQSSQPPPPHTPAVLPTLTDFVFEGAAEYVEDLLPRISTPSLYDVHVYLFYLPVEFDTPQLHNFLARSHIFESWSGAVVEFDDEDVNFRRGHQFSLGIQSGTFLGQLSSLVRVCNFKFSFPAICTLERLDICVNRFLIPPLPGILHVENFLWLEFFSPFTALKHLYLDKYCAQRIVRVLRQSGLAAEGATQALPSLQSLFIDRLSGVTEEAIREFVTMRQVSGLPVTAYSLEDSRGSSLQF